MFKFLAAGILWGGSAFAQMPISSIDIANLREDVRGLTQRVGELSLRLEQLERENNELRGRAGASERTYVTSNQLNAAVTDINATFRAAVANSKADTLQQVGVQMEKLAKQSNAAIDSLAKATTPRAPATSTTFTDDYPKEGISYTVQKGDTVAVIAKKTGAKQQDIMNANKIQDATKIQAGQTLFVPGGK